MREMRGVTGKFSIAGLGSLKMRSELWPPLPIPLLLEEEMERETSSTELDEQYFA